MARRSDHSREELKNIALNAAQTIIKTKGINSLSVRNVTKKIGYTVGTLYQLFNNLDDLILHVNALTLDELTQKLSLALNTPNPIQSMATCYLEYYRTHFNQWNALFVHRLPENQSFPDWYEKKIITIFNIIETAVKKEVPTLTTKSINRTTRILWAGLHGICTLSISGKLKPTKSESEEILIQNFIKNYLSGLKAPSN